MEAKNITPLITKVATAVTEDGDELRFDLEDGTVVRFLHDQDCCEAVYIESVVGDLADLVGTPIVVAEERTSTDESIPPVEGGDDYYTWTFYEFRTNKGSVTVRWFGTSNGYYSERVSIWITDPDHVKMVYEAETDQGRIGVC